MIVYLNGAWVPEAEAKVSVFDRGFLYGDGLFETMRAHGGRILRQAEHLARFHHGIAALGLTLPVDAASLPGLTLEALARNGCREAVVRLHLTRGRGPRGYSPRNARHPSLVISAHELPGGGNSVPGPWRLRSVRGRLLSTDPVAACKTSAKLAQVLARAEAEASGADEALLINELGEVVECSSANLFWFEPGLLATPPLSSGCLAGVTRAWLLHHASRVGWKCVERPVTPDDLKNRATGVFASLSTHGVVEVSALDDVAFPREGRLERVREWHQKTILDLLSG